MTIEEACEYVFNGWSTNVESYEIHGSTITLICKSNSGRSTYEGEVVIEDGGDHFRYSDPYGSNTPYLFGKNVCQMMTDGQITY